MKQKGTQKREMPLMKMQMLVTRRESTEGKSDSHPDIIRPTVLVMPIIESKNEAVSASTPY